MYNRANLRYKNLLIVYKVARLITIEVYKTASSNYY